MAKRSQQLKTQKQYKAALKQFRGKIRFDYDLRKNLTRGQKSAISRVLNQTPTDQTAKFLEPKRTRGETGTAFAKRLNTIKHNSGQDGSPFKGIWAKVPKGAKTSFKGSALNITVPAQNFSEVHKPINNQAIASDGTRFDYLRKTMAEFEAQGFTGVAFRMGTGRTKEFEIDEVELMIEELNRWVSEYGKQESRLLFNEILNGMILTVRP